MAGRKMIKKGMIAASTIVEVVVAMVIIVVIFGMAMMIFANVTQQALSTKKIRAAAILQNVLLTAEQTRELPEQPFNQDNLRIIPELKPVENEPELSELRLTAYDENQQKITEVREILIKKYEP